MTVYGFNDRNTAIKVKRLVETSSAIGSKIPDNGFDEQGGFAFQNKTGKTIPPYALIFTKRNPNQTSGTVDYPAAQAFAYSQVKATFPLENSSWNLWVKDAWAFSNSMPVEPDEYGWAQSRDSFIIGFDKATGGFDDGTLFEVDETNDFQVRAISENDINRDLIQWRGYQVLSTNQLGGEQSQRLVQMLVPYGNKAREIEIVRAVRVDEERFRITEPGSYFDDIVPALNTGNYPSAIGAKAFLLNPGFSIEIPGGGFGGGANVFNWWIMEEQYLEAENPNPGGDGGTGPGTP